MPRMIPLILDGPPSDGAQPVTFGLPFPQGALPANRAYVIREPHGAIHPCQTTPLATWPDGSIRWLLIDSLIRSKTVERTGWQLEEALEPDPELAWQVQERNGTIRVSDGLLSCMLGQSHADRWMRIDRNGEPLNDDRLTAIILQDARGQQHRPRWTSSKVESAGPLRATIAQEGTIGRRRPLRIVLRFDWYARTGLVRLRLTLHNPRRARHRGGLWDLGDPGSVYFQQLSLRLALPSSRNVGIRWQAEIGKPWQASASDSIAIYQDSSGGENWQSRNHMNCHRRVPCRFRGYTVESADRCTTGHRAQPTVQLRDSRVALSACIPEFWQQFPKSIAAGPSGIDIGLFPAQWDDRFELQPGEQKTHTVWLHFGSPEQTAQPLGWVHEPLLIRADRDWYAASGAFPDFFPELRAETLDRYLEPLIEGPNSLEHRREIIDEYGWRHFGDVYADHENDFADAPRPIVSHYNNQFDVIFGCILNHIRTGNRAYQRIWDPLARHVIDIDIYRTARDRACYNGGLFWLTDHYRDAGTSTHRTYSRMNKPPGQPYGGGPASAHNFTRGLLHYYYLTGDPQGSAAVLSLANWVIAMDDGRQNLFRWFDRGPTGLATFTLEPGYHGPGRGAGFSLQALLDAWELTEEPRYLLAAEAIIRRVIHPCDDIAALELDDAERRWSYPVFLVAVHHYLRMKLPRNEPDATFAYALASLQHYGAWMAANERPFLDRRDSLEYVTEAWPAQDMRKANAMRVIALWCEEPLRSQLNERAEAIADRAWSDLAQFPNRHSARAAAVLLTEGLRDAFLRDNKAHIDVTLWKLPDSDFGQPVPFIPQKQRVIQSAVGKLRLIRDKLRFR